MREEEIRSGAEARKRRVMMPDGADKATMNALALSQPAVQEALAGKLAARGAGTNHQATNFHPFEAMTGCCTEEMLPRYINESPLLEESTIDQASNPLFSSFVIGVAEFTVPVLSSVHPSVMGSLAPV